MTATTPSLDNPATWTFFHPRMCRNCQAWCCRLPAEVTIADLITMEMLTDFDSQELARSLAKRLKKQGIIEHFHDKSGKFTLARGANGDCLFLGAADRRCAIYDQRPPVCRNHPRVGPRPGFCPHAEK